MNHNCSLLVVLEHSLSYFYYKEALGMKSETTPMHLNKISGKEKGTN